MKCKGCENYLQYNNTAYGYCRTAMCRVAGDQTCPKIRDEIDMETGIITGRPKKTNADRIRAMTDEELAEYHNMLKDDNCCPNQGAMDCRASCEECWLKWLKEEVKE